MTVLPVLLAIREFRERYQGGQLSEVAEGVGWLKEANLGGAEAGRGGGRVEPGLDPDEDVRLSGGGESRAVFIGVTGGVSRGVVGVAGWTTIASLGETSNGVSFFALEALLGEPAASSSGMVSEQSKRRKWWLP